MTWILLILIYTSQGLTTQTTHFNNEAACRMALHWMLEQSTWSKDVRAECFQGTWP